MTGVAHARGFTYLGELLATAGQAWHTQAMREREEELLYLGDQYDKKAIVRFHAAGARCPRELAELLMDPRWPDTHRYLRKLYADPVTGENEWGFVKTADGSIAGLPTLSEDAPFNTAGFKLDNTDFEGREKYSEWQFALPPGPTSLEALAILLP
jgi:hypothetical protein